MFRAVLFSLLFVFTSVVATPLLAQNDSVNRVDDNGLKQGRWIKKEKGIKRYEGQFKNDKPFGRFTYYHTNGKTKSITDYSSDGSIAMTKLYDTDGLLEASGKYINRIKDSTWTFYFKGGEKISSIETWKNGKKNGIMKTFFIDGKIATECRYVDDNPEGPCKEYYTSGTVKKEYAFKNGMLDGTFKTFFMNNMPDISGKYENALKVGDWVEYNENGKIKLRRSFRNGILYKEAKINGSFKEYYADGIPSLDVTYRDGLKNGPFKEYHDIGKWTKKRKPAQDGEEREDYIEVLEGTVVKSEGTYLNDKLDGKITTFDEKGKVIKVENYKEGVLQK